MFLVTEERRYLETARKCLQISVRFYEQCFQQRQTVNWYSTSRVHAICAWDWLYNHLSETERTELLARLVQVIDNVLQAKPTIYRENMSGYDTGFYGVRNCLWFLGCTAFGTGIETERINRWLVWGHDENLRMLEHRRRACVLIHQPGEPPARYWGGTVEANHGGQHRQIGSVLKAFHTSDDYVYVAGDATACYQRGVGRSPSPPGLGEKCSLVTRQLVFLIPNHFVVFDRVVATDPKYRKDWLIHTAYELQIVGRAIHADHGRGRMFCRTLLPADAVFTAVGGPGKEFLAAGKNWSIEATGLRPEQLAMMGQ